MEQERNYSMDLLKIILAFLIVLHHSPSPFHDIIQPITTCAVPAFFMISGFFIFRKEISVKRIIKNALRILKILLWCLLIFYIWNWVSHGKPYVPNLKDILVFVFANNVPFGGHLWYLAAYLYALIILAFLAKIDKVHWFKYLAIGGLSLYFIFDIWHIWCKVPRYLTLVYCFRNFFFTAVPMMYLGGVISKYKPLKITTITASLIALSICAVAEMGIFHVNHIADYFFITIPLSFSVVCLFANCQIRKPNILTKCGEKHSLYIYLLHPIIIKLLTGEFGKDTYFVGVSAFILTLLVSVLFVASKDKVKSIIYQHK